jgi:hypothetical protein
VKEENIFKLENQIEEYKNKFRKASDELYRLEEKNKMKMNDFASIQDLKKDLEHKVNILESYLLCSEFSMNLFFV